MGFRGYIRLHKKIAKRKCKEWSDRLVDFFDAGYKYGCIIGADKDDETIKVFRRQLPEKGHPAYDKCVDCPEKIPDTTAGAELFLAFGKVPREW